MTTGKCGLQPRHLAVPCRRGAEEDLSGGGGWPAPETLNQMARAMWNLMTVVEPKPSVRWHIQTNALRRLCLLRVGNFPVSLRQGSDIFRHQPSGKAPKGARMQIKTCLLGLVCSKV